MLQSPQPSAPFRARLDAFARELPGVEQGSVQALHRARVASRRLRELLPLLTLERETALKLKRRLREVTRRLGEVRELDVLALLIEELRRNVRYRPAGLDRLEASVTRARQEVRARLPETLSPSKLHRLAERLERVNKTDGERGSAGVTQGVARPKRAWLWALEARLAQRAARVRTTIDVAGTIYAVDRLHDVRIALKKLRYVTELLHEAGRKHVAADLSALKSAQDLLGRLHDFEVLMARGRDAQALLSPGDVDAGRELGLLLLGLEDDCRRMHGRYMQDRAALIATADRLRAAPVPAKLPGRRGSPVSRAERGAPARARR